MITGYPEKICGRNGFHQSGASRFCRIPLISKIVNPVILSNCTSQGKFMKRAVHVLRGVLGVLSIAVLTSCVSGLRLPFKADAVTGATAAYASGDRGTLPPAGEGYEVLGVREGIKNWAIRYDDTLIRGGEFYADSAAQALREWGVKTIVSAAPSAKERAFCAQHGFALVEIPFDKARGPTAGDIRTFLDTVKTGQGPFYVHCVGGAHRGGVLGVAYRLHVLNWPAERALVEFGRLGGNLKDDHGMLEAVRSYAP